MFVLLQSWQSFYVGQDNLFTEVKWTSTPPVGEWGFKISMRGRDGKLFFEYDACLSRWDLPIIKERWVKSGFPEFSHEFSPGRGER